MNIVSKLSEMLKTNEINQPIIYKPFTEGYNLDKMVKLLETNESKELKRDIRFLKQGLQGEKDVYFELKNCDIPMIILHDVRLDFNAYIAQYDYCLITSKNIYVLEVKSLTGDLTIKKSGEFIRTINNKVVGMFSPISQNMRHLTVMEKLFEKNTIEVSCPIKSIVVLTNSKSVVTFDSDVPIKYKEQICRLDQLIERVKKWERDSLIKNNELLMKRIGNLLLTNDRPIFFNLEKKYQHKKNEPHSKSKFNKYNSNRIVKKVFPKKSSKKKDDVNTSVKTFKNVDKNKNHIKNKKKSKNNQVVKVITREEMLELLKTFRLSKSKEENTKPYRIFSNAEMDELINKKPKCKEELLNLKGFGKTKVNRYGADLLKIINQ